jgi:pSer/pThr/pTyr-binding forkhead associated (FHA) protein
MDDRSTEAIWRACGAIGPLRIGVKAGDSEDLRVIPYPFALIGREPGCDIILEKESVSRRHALMLVIDGRVFVVDLASREGTLWGDGARQSGWVEGAHGIGIGGFQICPQTLAPTDLAAAGEPPNGNPLRTWSSSRKRGSDMVLEVLSPQTKKTRWRISRAVTLIGRAPECKMRLMDSSVSSMHCALVCTPMGLWAIDLLGRDGILVNDRQARFARMSDNDDLRIGRFLFRARGEMPRSSTRAEVQADSSRSVGLPAVLAWQGGPPASLGSSEPRMFVPAVIGSSETDLDIAAKSSANPNAYLMPIVEALRMLQQHDQAQHHQTMMMLQTIFAMHGEQIRDVRNQLDHVLRVLGEMRSLPSDPSWVDRLALAARTETRAAPANGQNGLGSSPFAAWPSNGPAPSWTSPRGTGTTSSPESKTAPSATNSAAAAAPPPPVLGVSAQANPAEPATEGKTVAVDKEPFVQDPEVNNLICARLDEIRRERMSIWDKILDMVGGK